MEGYGPTVGTEERTEKENGKGFTMTVCACARIAGRVGVASRDLTFFYIYLFKLTILSHDRYLQILIRLFIMFIFSVVNYFIN
jgi:hypothetical protein